MGRAEGATVDAVSPGRILYTGTPERGQRKKDDKEECGMPPHGG
jgi:hypothetical protein